MRRRKHLQLEPLHFPSHTTHSTCKPTPENLARTALLISTIRCKHLFTDSLQVFEPLFLGLEVGGTCKKQMYGVPSNQNFLWCTPRNRCTMWASCVSCIRCTCSASLLETNNEHLLRKKQIELWCDNQYASFICSAKAHGSWDWGWNAESLCFFLEERWNWIHFETRER
jgi:hypothetical protein